MVLGHSSKGYSLVAMCAVIALASLTLMGTIGGYMLMLGEMKSNYSLKEEIKDLQNEVNIIFSNNAICSQVVLMDATGATFTLTAPPSGTGAATPIFSPGAVYKKYIKFSAAGGIPGAVGTITATAPFPSPPLTPVVGYLQSLFTIQFSLIKYPTVTQSVSANVAYTLGAGNVMASCGLAVDPATACTQSGAAWYPSTNLPPGRCGICELMGGTWNSSTLPNGACAL